MNPPPIKTSYWKKPIPSRMHDWEAWYDGQEECYCATGPTETDAIADLIAHGPYEIEQESEWANDQHRWEFETGDKP